MKTLKIEGSLLFMNPLAKQQLREASESEKIILDLSGVEEIDSSGIDLLSKTILSIKRKNGFVRIEGAKPSVRELIEICGIDKYAEILP
jgi:anti-anti-sigma factor